MFQCNGIWWLPETPTEKVAGLLHFSDDVGITLSLAGILGESSPSLEEKSISIILGVTWDCPHAGELTLKDCRVKSHHLGSPGVMREDYFAERIFAGSHLEREEDFSFSRASIAFSGLSSWAASYTGLRHQQVPAGEGHRGGFEIQWLPPEPISGKIPGGYLTMGVGAKFAMPRREWLITEEVGLSISLDTPLTAEQLTDRYAYPLQNLMTLATDHPNSLVDFSVERPNIRGKIHVLAARTFHDTKAAADLLPYKMLFSLGDFKDRTVDLIARWIDISDRLSDVCGPYFGIQYKPDSFVDVKFLVVFQSLEVYQRKTAPKTLLASPQGGPLDDIVRQLVELHWGAIGPLFGGNLAAAVKEIVSYRNYVVHRNSDLDRRETYGADLYWLTQKLMFLMKACLMAELGISSEEQRKFFERNQMYIHLLGLGGK